MNDNLEKLLASKKYKDVCPDTVKRIWDECSLKYKKDKDIDKALVEGAENVKKAQAEKEEAKAKEDDAKAKATKK